MRVVLVLDDSFSHISGRPVSSNISLIFCIHLEFIVGVALSFWYILNDILLSIFWDLLASMYT